MSNHFFGVYRISMIPETCEEEPTDYVKAHNFLIIGTEFMAENLVGLLNSSSYEMSEDWEVTYESFDPAKVGEWIAESALFDRDYIAAELIQLQSPIDEIEKKYGAAMAEKVLVTVFGEPGKKNGE